MSKKTLFIVLSVVPTVICAGVFTQIAISGQGLSKARATTPTRDYSIIFDQTTYVEDSLELIDDDTGFFTYQLSYSYQLFGESYSINSFYDDAYGYAWSMTSCAAGTVLSDKTFPTWVRIARVSLKFLRGQINHFQLRLNWLILQNP